MKRIYFLMLILLSFGGFALQAIGDTREAVEKLKISSNNPQGDYFLGSSQELTPIIQSMVKDNSGLDATYLYLTANTALRLNRLTDAAFLFYAAQIRKSFDIKRYGLAAANGNNLTTYLGFLNQTIGQNLNPAIMREPDKFSEAISMIEKWNVVPNKGGLYDGKDYGKPAIPEKAWAALADATKKDFLDNFGLKLKNFFQSKENREAFVFVQDYNFGKIQKTPETQKKYSQSLAVLQKNGIVP